MPTALGWVILAIRRASRSNRFHPLSFWTYSGLTSFRALSRCSGTFSTRQTSPIPPSPIFSSSRYLPKTSSPLRMVGAGRMSQSSVCSPVGLGAVSSDSAESFPSDVANGGGVVSAPATVPRPGISGSSVDPGAFRGVGTSGNAVGTPSSVWCQVASSGSCVGGSSCRAISVLARGAPILPTAMGAKEPGTGLTRPQSLLHRRRVRLGVAARTIGASADVRTQRSTHRVHRKTPMRTVEGPIPRLIINQDHRTFHQQKSRPGRYGRGASMDGQRGGRIGDRDELGEPDGGPVHHRLERHDPGGQHTSHGAGAQDDLGAGLGGRLAIGPALQGEG